jgi:hypothetical protein
MSKTNSKQPRSAAQAAASRNNGSKSKGPTTEAGKAASSHNRVSHGFRASHVCLQNEDAIAYEDHLAAYIASYAPIDKPEADLVGLLASNMWQIMRNNSIEVALFDIEISNLGDEIRRTFENMDEYGRIALAFKKANGDNALELLRRYKTTSERAYHRALQALEDMRKNRASQPPAATPEDSAAVQTREEPEPPQTKPPLQPQPALHLVPQPATTNEQNTPKTEPNHDEHPTHNAPQRKVG